jgi:membrane fusion protein, copper/silver efflux system
VKPLGAGKYDISYPLAMLGDWTLGVEIRAPAHAPTELTLRVAPPHPGFTVENSGGDQPGSKLLEIPPERQQLIGVTYAKVERRQLEQHLRAPGTVQVDESQLAEVTLKYEAYVEKIFVDQTGQSVKPGQPLLTLYSPELLAAEKDYLLAKQGGGMGQGELLAAAEQKLRLWDISAEQIRKLAQTGQANPRLTIYSPAGGVVLEKNVVEGTRAAAGSTLYKIGNLGRVWVLADLSEWDLPNVSVGQPATMSIPGRGETSWRGQVQFIYPTIDPKTRALRARLAFANASLTLRPGMFVDVSIDVPLGVRLAVPIRALLASGEHRYAFVKRGEGRLQPVEVKVGAMAGDFAEVLDGLHEGDEVAIGPTFLLSSEAQLRDAMPKWTAP